MEKQFTLTHHPNGYTSVYAHLQKANGAIEEYFIKKAHIQRTIL